MFFHRAPAGFLAAPASGNFDRNHATYSLYGNRLRRKLYTSERFKFEIFTKGSGRSGRADIFEGIITWNAIRIIQKEDGMKLKADDTTFATKKVVTLPTNHRGWIEWLYATACRPAQTTSSFGNLKGLVYHFFKMLSSATSDEFLFELRFSRFIYY